MVRRKVLWRSDGCRCGGDYDANNNGVVTSIMCGWAIVMTGVILIILITIMITVMTIMALSYY